MVFFYGMCHLSSTFCEKQVSSFCVILPANKQANRKINSDENNLFGTGFQFQYFNNYNRF